MPYSYKSYTVTEATRLMERYCMYQERCHKEVRDKLRSMRMIPQAIDQITVHLIEEGFLNEERFAMAFTRGKFRMKSWGKRRLRLELRQKDISERLILLALSEIDESDYLNSFHSLAEKRWNELASEKDVWLKKKKLVDYLRYRGWESDLIYDKIASLTRKESP